MCEQQLQSYVCYFPHWQGVVIVSATTAMSTQKFVGPRVRSFNSFEPLKVGRSAFCARGGGVELGMPSILATSGGKKTQRHEDVCAKKRAFFQPGNTHLPSPPKTHTFRRASVVVESPRSLGRAAAAAHHRLQPRTRGGRDVMTCRLTAPRAAYAREARGGQQWHPAHFRGERRAAFLRRA